MSADDSIALSVCMATYNGEPFVVEQLRSILAQLPDNAEVVISDDHSTDQTVCRINSLGDPRIKVIQNSLSPGISGNIQNALLHSRGKILILSDQDDIWLPGKTAEVLNQLQSCDLVCHDCILIDEQGNPLDGSLFERLKARPGLIRNLYRNSYTGCCMAFRRHLLDIALPVPETVYMHDVWLGLLAEIYGNVSFVDKKLMAFRRHQNSLTATGFRSRRPLWKKVVLRLSLVYQLGCRVLSISTGKKIPLKPR
ncbi:MAG: glycosyltransferase family 2 protein [Gammaproteobacteria bacterium]|nr:glycosyltransferase family 2 protein [Gammaproteobacteria bacterium]